MDHLHMYKICIQTASNIWSIYNQLQLQTGIQRNVKERKRRKDHVRHFLPTNIHAVGLSLTEKSIWGLFVAY